VPSLRLALLVAALIAVAGAVALLVIVNWYRRRTGLGPELGAPATVVASDTGAAPPARLREPTLGLRGRPDYLLEQKVDERTLLVPLELKPTRRSARVYESDAVQLGAYLLALRAMVHERAAPFGYVRYATGTFRVPLTDALERRVRAIVAAIRTGRTAAVVHRDHDVPARCVNCPVREHCDEALR
jgi:hypothetical protein